MADSRMPLSPTSASAVTIREKKNYNKALRELLKMTQNTKWIDNSFDSSEQEITDDNADDDGIHPFLGSTSNLFTEIDVTLPSLLMANPCANVSPETSLPVATKQNLRRPQNSPLKGSNSFPSEVRDIYDELSEISQKLQQERMSQQEYSLQLERREECLKEREELLLKPQATLCKIKGVEEIVHKKFQIMKEQHDVEVKQLSDALKEKNKENKRLKSSFDALKEMNDTLKKQLNEVSEQNKKLESQAKKVQSRLENLQRKQIFLTVQKSKDLSQVIRDQYPLKTAKTSSTIKSKVPTNTQVYKLLAVLMDWISTSEENGSTDKLLGTDKFPPNHVQKKCAKNLSALVEQFEWMPLVNIQVQVSFMRFLFWTLQHIESDMQSTMSSTLRRLGEVTYNGVLYHDDSTLPNKPRTVAFFKSNHLPLRFISTLIVLKTVTQVDYLAQALDSLCMDLKNDEGRDLFVKYQAVPTVVHLLYVSNKGLIAIILDILLQLSMETRFLQPFLESCCTEPFFRTCAALLRDPKVDVQILEKLSVVLQKLSKVRSNKKLFDIFNIPQVIREMQRTANPDHAFLVINLNSILFHLGFCKAQNSFS